MVSKITATIETVPTWGDDNFDANVHENFLKLKEFGPQFNKTVDEINQTFNDIDTYTKTASTKAGEAAQSANTANTAKQAAIQLAEIASTKSSEAAQSANTANTAKQAATQLAEIASTKANEVNNIKNEMIEVIEALQLDPLSIIASEELGKKINISDTQDTLDSNSTDKPLSANQGRVLKEFIDAINEILSSDDTTLDELQEIVSFIKQNKSTLDNLSINNIAGLPSALSNKITKVPSTNNAIARFDGTSGEVKNSSVIIDDSNRLIVENIVLKRSSDGHQVGSLMVDDVNNKIDLQSGYGLLSFSTSGIEKAKIDNNGNFLLTAGTGTLGYGFGTGGTVTQLTSKSTEVTLNKPTGNIVMNNANLAAGGIVGFKLNNNLIGQNDKIEVEPVFSAVTYNAYVYYSTSGAAYIALENKSGTIRADSVIIKFVIIKGSVS
ncbi:hypothetical protein [Aliarcobacter butzleri]|uniref:hypothetical protein n=1 Tax=Aliarcobacter butzleri TaxID=28197 RepID=UPI00125FAC84|nr:hypothetical protein [Aliarcobacter butzleri]